MDVKEFQQRYKLSNKEFASICGCSLPTVQKWRAVSGSVSPAAERLMRLLDYAACGNREQLDAIFNEVGLRDAVLHIGKDGVLERPNEQGLRLTAPENFLLAQRQVEELTRESNDLAGILDSIGDLGDACYAVSDSTFAVTWASKQFRSQFLSDSSDDKEATWIDLFADGEKAGEHWKNVRTDLFTEGKAVIQASVRGLSERIFQWSFVRLEGESEARIKYLLELKDVTDQRSLLGKLDAAVRTLDQVLEFDARPILVVSRNGRLLGASKSGHRLLDELDFSESQSVFKHVFADQTASQLRRLEALKEEEIFEFRRLMDGRDLKTLIRPLNWWGKKAFTLIFEQQVLSPLHVGKMTLRRLRTEQFVSSIFKTPDESQSEDQSGHNRRINEVLACVGNRLGVSRSYLFQIDFEGNCVSNTHEWCADGVQPEIDSLQNVPIDSMPYWWSCLRRSEPIVMNSMSDFPPEAETEKLFLEAQDVSAIAIYPIIVGQRLTGFVGFDYTKGERIWSEDDLMCLKMVRLAVEMAIESAGFKYESEVYRSEIKEILQGAELGFWRWSFTTDEFFADNRYLSMLGLDSAEPNLGIHAFESRVHPADLESFKRGLELHLKGDSDEAESVFRIKHQSGGWLWVLGRSKVIERTHDGSPEIVVGTLLDITEAKKREVELEETKRKLESSIRETSSVIARICSELRTPLNAVTGISEIFQQGGEERTSSLLIDQLDQSIASMSRTIQSLEYFTKVETGNISPVLETVNPRELADSIQRRYGPVFEGKNLTFSVNLESSLRSGIKIDERIFKHVIDQLVDNAGKFASEGAVRLQLYSEAGDNNQTWFVAELTDSGIGFDSQMHFVKESSGAKGLPAFRRSGGLGMGLNISSKLAAVMGGSLVVRSKPGAGTTAILRLPYVPVVESEPVIESKKPMLLLAEDHPVSQSIGKRILQMLGYEVTVVEHGKGALDWMQRNVPDVILLDMQMPIMSGWEFLEEFRKKIESGELKPAPVIITSALDLDVEEMTKDPVVAVIQKPYSIKSLKEALGEIFVGAES